MNKSLYWSLIPALIIFTGFFCYYSRTLAGGTGYLFENPGLYDCVLSSNGEFLYLAHPSENCVIEVATSDMTETRRFTVQTPFNLEFSPTEDSLYVSMRGDQGGLARINLGTGLVETFNVTGDVENFIVSPSGDKIWLLERLWPLDGDVLSDFPPPDTGKLTEISCIGPFTASNSVVIDSVPNTIYYSPISNQLYVKHNLMTSSYNEPPQPVGYMQRMPDQLSQKITVYNADTLVLVEEIEGGSDKDYDRYGQLIPWDPTGRYMTVLAYQYPLPPYTLRVVDTYDDTVSFDLSLPLFPATAGLQYAHKVESTDDLWANVSFGQLSETDTRRLMVKINMVTHEHEFFPVDEAAGRLGDFAISPDGNTFYLTVVPTGEVIVWHPSTP